jgi:hypothetical protein
MLICLFSNAPKWHVGEAGGAMALLCGSPARGLLSICEEMNRWAQCLPCMTGHEHYAAL